MPFMPASGVAGSLRNIGAICSPCAAPTFSAAGMSSATDRRRSSMRMLCLETGVSRRMSADNSGLSTVRAAERTCIVTNIKLLHGVASPPKATNKWS